MPLALTITAKGQVTFRQAVLDHLGLRPGDKVDVALLPGGRVELKSSTEGHDLGSLRAALRRPGQRTVSLDEMRDAIESGARRR